MEQISIEKVKKTDFESLVKLYEDVWPDVDYDKRKKANFIVNESNGINYCAKRGNEVVGSRTSCPFNFFYGSRKLKTVQVGDSCVHPSCRGKGLFLKMNQAFLDEFFGNENKGELIYNISVFASRKAYEKLGWKYIESLMSIRKFVNPIKTLFKLKFNLKRVSNPIIWDRQEDEITIDERLLESREDFLNHVDLLHVRYDEPTIKWRLKSQSGIKLVKVDNLGCILYKIGHRGVLVEVEIGEIFLYDYTQKNFKELLSVFIKQCHPDIVKVLVSEGHPLKAWYKSCLFLSNPKQKYLHHGVRVETEEMKRICYEPKNWAISSLDIDTF